MEMASTLGYKREETFTQKVVGSKAFWLIFWAFLFAYPIYRSYNRELPPELPVQFNLPSYSLTNEFGKAFGSRDLDGKVYLVTFTRAECDSICEANMKQLQKIQKRMKGVRKESAMISITLDAGKDTPQSLNKLGRALDANPFFWNFLSADKAKVDRLLSDGFRIKELDDSFLGKLFLVDRRNRVRGLYKTDKESINKLMIDVGLLINRDQLYK